LASARTGEFVEAMRLDEPATYLCGYLVDVMAGETGSSTRLPGG